MDKDKVSLISRLWAIPAYLWVFAFLPYFLKRKDEFVYFHAKQGVVIFIVELFSLLIFPIPFIGQVIGLIGLIFCSLLALRGMLSGLSGKKWSMPWLNRYTEKIIK
ncbi:MAG: hypothetical protein N2259_00505 [Patescibacteria group bacterium]|nr:hypothetical protein [Patescibacteria group bacterium]